MKLRKKHIALIALTVASLAVTTGCSSSNGGSEKAKDTSLSSSTPWADIVKQANAEGEVTLYLAENNYTERIEGFRKEYPKIKLTVNQEVTGSLITKLAAEKASGSAGGDVVQLSNYGWFHDNAADLTPAYGPSAALYTDKVDPAAGKDYFTTNFVPFNIVSNTTVLKSIGAHPIKTWTDLLQPQLKDLIGVTRPDNIPIETQLYNALNDELGSSFFTDLKKLNPQLGDSSGNLYQSVAAGNLAVAIGGTTTTSHALKEAGAPIDVPAGTKPSFVFGYASGIPNWTKHPAAAQVLLEWMISKKGQEFQNNWGVSGSVLPNIPGAMKLDTSKVYTGALTDKEKKFLSDTWIPLFN